MSTYDSNCIDGASKSNDDCVCDVRDKLQNMSIGVAVSICANCGKEGDEINNICNKCKVATYCNAVCKKVHKKKHKKDCEEHIRLAAEKYDEKLFTQPPPEEDCPICMIRLPTLATGLTYMHCCGKSICRGCVHAFQSRITKDEDEICPFCRAPIPTSVQEITKRLEKRMEMNDADAICNLGFLYFDGGVRGVPRNVVKALELWHRAAELGNAMAYYGIGSAYKDGRGVDADHEKAIHYLELSAMMGDVNARHDLGIEEENVGDINRALKHFMIAVKDGCADSLNSINLLYSKGNITKDNYAKALREYQAYLDEIKSNQRDEAAAARVAT